MRLPILILALLATACPTFEDERSGTYRQIVTDVAPGEQAVAVEVFRYGHNVQVIVRRYEDGADPFDDEMSCTWGEPTQMREDGSFETVMVGNTGPQIRMSARFEDDGTMTARINAPNGNSPDLRLELVTETPDDTCRTIAARSVTAKFGNLSSTNEFAAGEYTIQNPYFGIQWIAVQPIQTGNVFVWTAFTPELIFVPLASKVTSNRRGLSGALNLLISPPDEDYRTSSGDTRYSLAHFIVVDDDAEDDTFVGWDRTTEPIIASGFRGGTRPDAPAGAENHTHYGLALLFVEGRLDQLGSLLDVIELEEFDTNGDGEPEKVAPDQHFYVAEIYAEEERIVGMRLSPSPLLTIPVTVTSEFLDDDAFPLPRLFPLD